MYTTRNKLERNRKHRASYCRACVWSVTVDELFYEEVYGDIEPAHLFVTLNFRLHLFTSLLGFGIKKINTTKMVSATGELMSSPETNTRSLCS